MLKFLWTSTYKVDHFENMKWQYHIPTSLPQPVYDIQLGIVSSWLESLDIMDPLFSLSADCHEYVMNNTFHSDCQPSSKPF